MTEAGKDIDASVLRALGTADVRAAFAKLTEAGARALHKGEQLVQFVHSVLGAAFRAQPAAADGPLREVITGVGDGLATAALAAHLAIEEAGRRGERFAKEDMARIAGELDAALRGFTTGVAKAVTGSVSASKDLLSHANATLDRIRPSLQQALDAVREQPARTAQEAAGESARVVRRGAGALFTAFGEQLKTAGKRLRRDRP
ncbi:MAG TPA: hypothetical protein VF384_16255 [Planctomycetota bacterium]